MAPPYFKAQPNTPLRVASKLKDALRRFSNIAASREFGVLEFGEVGEIADGLLAALHEQMTGGGSAQQPRSSISSAVRKMVSSLSFRM